MAWAVTLEACSGSAAGKKLALQLGRPLQVGRTAPAHLLVADDALMSDVHFALEWDGRTCRLRDLDSRFGTLLNQGPVTQAVLKDGDEIVAGWTKFLVRMEGAPSAPNPPPVAAVPPTGAPATDWVLSALRKESESLYAVLDAARTPRVLELLHAGPAEFKSLYEGEKGDRLAAFAPYLVRFSARSALLETLLREGWGQSWGVFLAAAEEFAPVRKHLRRFLTVRADGRELYFRFYDPRVLRVYLPTCTPDEARQFLGPIRSYLLEADGPDTLLRFAAGPHGLERTTTTAEQWVVERLREEVAQRGRGRRAGHVDHSQGTTGIAPVPCAR
jgi:hypothetical protein